jgi:DNA-binding MarR family transcriptional regulator
MADLNLSAVADSILKNNARISQPAARPGSASATEDAFAALQALARGEDVPSIGSGVAGEEPASKPALASWAEIAAAAAAESGTPEFSDELAEEELEPEEEEPQSIWLGSRPELEPADGRPFPKEPSNIAATGLTETMVEQLVLKAIYFRGDITGGELADALGLKYSILEPLVENFRRQQIITVKRSLGMGTISAVLALTEHGRQRAQENLESCQYAGVAPVPMDQYVKLVMAQKLPDSWLDMDMLRKAYGHMVVTDELLGIIGPAVNSGKSFLIYGQPGNGKTFLAEALFKLHSEPIYVPYAVECQGMVIQLFDPIYHTRIEEDASASPIFKRTEAPYDRRWFRTKRPFIVSGGELSLEALDLSYNAVAKTYDAPLHMKANNGIYLIDDFGRQKVTPAEVLNRWIVPMEKRIDYLTFQNGGKLELPFEVFLVFSTNLNPEKIGDEAFLRRIQYKMLMKSPGEDEFKTIFYNFANSKGLKLDPGIADRLLERHYRKTGKPKRRCHPRDVLLHAIDYIRFQRLPFELTDEVLDHAFLSCFIDTSENG